jgi:hypothetical protein
MVEVRLTGQHGEEMALSKGGKGNDRGLLFKLVQTSKMMA